MRKTFYYVEYEFPQDLKDLYWGLPGTGILRILMDQHIQETDSADSKILKTLSYEDVAIFPWKKTHFAYSIQFENKSVFDEWKGHRADLIAWLDSSYNIKCIREEFGIAPEKFISSTDSDETIQWKSRKYFFEDLPNERGFTSNNIISGIPEIHSQKFPNKS